jgi:hypothetical protein
VCKGDSVACLYDEVPQAPLRTDVVDLSMYRPELVAGREELRLTLNSVHI